MGILEKSLMRGGAGIGSPTDTARHISRDPFVQLGNGIILQAVKDFRASRNALKEVQGEGPMDRAMEKRVSLHEGVVEECGRFFMSEYFMLLTGTDGAALLKKLMNE